MLRSAEWEERAACRLLDPELFFPVADGEGAGRATREAVGRAKAVCAGCPVVRECLATALARGERFGVWGGKTAAERRRLVRAGVTPVRLLAAAGR